MADDLTTNLRVSHLSALLPPSCVFDMLPGGMQIYSQVIETRDQVMRLLSGSNDRFVIVVGPPPGCENPEEALLELADFMKQAQPGFASELLLILAVDAALKTDPAYITRGVQEARELLLQINERGVPVACEFCDTITPQFFCDLLSWACVSAQSQMLCDLVSGLSMPVGLCATASEVDLALSVQGLANEEHHFLGVSAEGVCGVVQSTGNPDVHVVLHAATAADVKSLAARVGKTHPATRFMLSCTAGPNGAVPCGAEVAMQLSSSTASKLFGTAF